MCIYARRPRLLPDGATIPDAWLQPFAQALLKARQWVAERPRVLKRDDEAAETWRGVYETLTTDRPGMYGAATSRAEAQVLRLSVTYAALDCSPVITADHLLAALAVWTYADESSRWALGDAVGDPITDTILAALRRVKDLDRQSISDLFSRNVNRARIDRAEPVARGRAGDGHEGADRRTTKGGLARGQQYEPVSTTEATLTK